MVSLRRHFVPNPVSPSRPDPSPKCQRPLFRHTRYDGLNRRVVQFYDFGVYGEYYDYSYHNASWQLLERRYDQGQGGQPETLQPTYQYVWSARYLDAPVLRDTNTDTDGDEWTADAGTSDARTTAALGCAHTERSLRPLLQEAE